MQPLTESRAHNPRKTMLNRIKYSQVTTNKSVTIRDMDTFSLAQKIYMATPCRFLRKSKRLLPYLLSGTPRRFTVILLLL